MTFNNDNDNMARPAIQFVGRVFCVVMDIFGFTRRHYDTTLDIFWFHTTTLRHDAGYFFSHDDTTTRRWIFFGFTRRHYDTTLDIFFHTTTRHRDDNSYNH